FDSSRGLFYFYPGSNSNSIHSFAVVNPEAQKTGSPWDLSTAGFDFSNNRDTQSIIGSTILTAYRSDTTTRVPWAVGFVTASREASYSPELHWFLYNTDYLDGYWTLHEWSTTS